MPFIIAFSDSLNEQRKSGSFCDIVVKLNDKSFPAHRGVLCAASGYFQGRLPIMKTVKALHYTTTNTIMQRENYTPSYFCKL